VYVACAVGAALTYLRKDPIYAGVIAWALAAVADERGWIKMRGQVDESVLQIQRITAKTGSAAMLLVAATPVAAQLLKLTPMVRK
jgi:hypothetical protein